MPSVVSAITAASAQIPAEKWAKATKAGGKSQEWQAEAWDMLGLVGELSFAMSWKVALLSRFRLVASDLDPETGKPTGSTEDEAAKAIVRQIAGGATGQAQLIARCCPLLMLPGEGWMAVIHPEPTPEHPEGVEEWHILSNDEVKSQGTKVLLTMPDGSTYTMNPADDHLARIWRQDPRIASQAWSPVKAALPILREIVRMTQNIEAAGKSRQAGNGILVLPNEMSLPQNAPTGEPDPDAPGLPVPSPMSMWASAGDIQAALLEAMSTAINDPSSAAALVPIILTGPSEHIGNIEHIRFDSEVSEKAQAAREAAVRRLAMTLDMPPEVLLGMADLNHWSLAGVEEEAVRWHAAPEMELICDFLTRELLRPNLPDSNVVVWYDASDVEAEPDQVEKVANAYAVGVATAEAYARQLGLPDTDTYDLTTAEGWRVWATDQVRKDPTLLPTLAPLLTGVPALPAAPAPTAPAAPPPALETADPRVPDTRPGTELTAAATAVVRLCVNEALRLAGKRRTTRQLHATMRGVPARDRHLTQHLGAVPASQVGRLIEGWDEAVDDQSLSLAGLDRERLAVLVTQAATNALTLGRPPVVRL